MRTAILLLVLACAAALGPGTPAMADDDVEFTVSVWKVHRQEAELWVPPGRNLLISTVQAEGPAGARVAVTIDFSGLDRARVSKWLVTREASDQLATDCRLVGDSVRCEWTITAEDHTQFSVNLQLAGGVTLGPAGRISVRGERLDMPDSRPGNNTAIIETDVRGDGNATVAVNAQDAAGSVGDTVTVPVTVVNRGPNTFRKLVLSHPSGGGGTDFKGGAGCVTTPVPQCVVGWVAPGATKTFNLKFHIRRCFQPMPSDPEFGASTRGSIALSHDLFEFVEGGRHPWFEIKINGCSRPGAIAGGLTPTVAPASESPAAATGSPPGVAVAVAPDATIPPQAQLSSRRSPLATSSAGVLVFLAVVIGLLRLHRRRNGA